MEVSFIIAHWGTAQSPFQMDFANSAWQTRQNTHWARSIPLWFQKVQYQIPTTIPSTAEARAEADFDADMLGYKQVQDVGLGWRTSLGILKSQPTPQSSAHHHSSLEASTVQEPIIDYKTSRQALSEAISNAGSTVQTYQTWPWAYIQSASMDIDKHTQESSISLEHLHHLTLFSLLLSPGQHSNAHKRLLHHHLRPMSDATSFHTPTTTQRTARGWLPSAR
jgi:hypothetical protein